MTTLKNELANLKTDEQVYKYVRDFLINQNKKSENRNDGCAYRGEDNTKCAIGCLILDEFYDETFEGGLPNKETGTRGKRIIEAISKSLPNWTFNMKLIENVQEIHDTYEPDSWKYEFNRREEKFGWFTYHYWMNTSNMEQ